MAQITTAVKPTDLQTLLRGHFDGQMCDDRVTLSRDSEIALSPDPALLDQIRAANGLPKPGEQVTIELKLTPAEQRRIVEADQGGPCFRMWLTPNEHREVMKTAPDYSHGQLSDTRYFCWRPQRALDELLTSSNVADHALAKHLQGRIIHDDNIA